MAGSGTLQDLVAKFALSFGQLEAEISSEHLVKISRITVEYEFLGILLGLTKAELELIRCDYRSLERQRFAMLRKWKQKYAWKATYHKLIEALLRCRRPDLAKEVCELLVQCYQQPPSFAPSAHSVHREEQPPSQPALVQVEGEATSQVRQNVTLLEKKFEDLVIATSSDLEMKKVPIPKIIKSLSVDTLKKIDLVASHQHEIQEINTVDDLFGALSAEKCWDFLNPGLLKRIIDDQCSESLDIQHQKREYLEELQRFRKTTTAQQFAKVCNMSTLSPKFSEVVSQMGKGWENATLEDLEKAL